MNFARFAFSETGGALYVLGGHCVGVRIARFADVVQEYFHAFRKKGMPLRSSMKLTGSPIATRSPSMRAVRRFPSSREMIASWYGASATNCSGGANTTVSV